MKPTFEELAQNGSRPRHRCGKFLRCMAARDSALCALSALLLVTICGFTAVPMPAQGPPPPPPPPPVYASPQLEQLVAPIALYPDPLLAQVLPASTFSNEIPDADGWALAHS